MRSTLAAPAPRPAARAATRSPGTEEGTSFISSRFHVIIDRLQASGAFAKTDTTGLHLKPGLYNRCMSL